MKMVTRFGLLVFAASLFSPVRVEAQSDAIRTKRSEFRIPFTFEKDEYERLGVQEVQLFLSTDLGASWQHVQSALPTSQKFRYKTQRQGEHWFAVRTLDRNRQLHPQGKLTAGLKVLVDTVEPDLTMRLTEMDGSLVKVMWQASDSDLDTSSMRLEYMEEGTSAWIPAEFAPTASGEAMIATTGRDKVTVRLGMGDLAGNVGVAERVLRFKSAEPISIQPRGVAAPVEPARNTSLLVSSHNALMSDAPMVPTPPPAIAPTMPPSPPVVMQETPVLPPTPEQVLGPYTFPPDNQQLPVAQPVAPQPMAPQPMAPQPMAPQPVPVQLQTRTVSAPIAPARSLIDLPVLPGTEPSVASQPTPAPNPTPTPPPVEEETPEPEIDPSLPRIVNQLQFRLDYALEDLGPSGLSSVEVFITEDGGKKWWRYGQDQDKQSPVILRVPRDGTYGFMIAAKSGVGLGDAPPAPGEAPHAVVIVDRAPPKARFDRIAMSDDGRTMTVNWKTADGNAHARPVRMEYAETPAGPWTPMSDWLQDSGEMKWSVPKALPSRVHVRMVVRDAADNMGQIVYPQAVLVDMSRPRARITNVKISRIRE